MDTLGNPRPSSYLQASQANTAPSLCFGHCCPCSWWICRQLLCGLFSRGPSAEAGAVAPSSITPRQLSLFFPHVMGGGSFGCRGWRGLPRTKEGKQVSTGLSLKTRSCASCSTQTEDTFMPPLLLWLLTLYNNHGKSAHCTALETEARGSKCLV